jgi:hypothetical protein
MYSGDPGHSFLKVFSLSSRNKLKERERERGGIKSVFSTSNLTKFQEGKWLVIFVLQ